MAENENNNDKTNIVHAEVNKNINKAITNSADQHNIIFRQMASNLILVAGIFLALASNFGKNLSNSSNAVKIMTLLVIVLLILSILFGILQHFLEAQYFRSFALGRRKIQKAYAENTPGNLDKLTGAMTEFERRQTNSTKRWPTVVQMCCLGIAMVLISVSVGLEMYDF